MSFSPFPFLVLREDSYTEWGGCPVRSYKREPLNNAHINTHTYTQIYMYTSTHLHTYTHTHTLVHMHTHTHINIHTYTHTYEIFLTALGSPHIDGM